jgi:hypothetical protein
LVRIQRSAAGSWITTGSPPPWPSQKVPVPAQSAFSVNAATRVPVVFSKMPNDELTDWM